GGREHDDPEDSGATVCAEVPRSGKPHLMMPEVDVWHGAPICGMERKYEKCNGGKMSSQRESTNKNRNSIWFALCAVVLIGSVATGTAQAQVPADIEAALLKIGQIVDPPCTAKLYRPLMPKNDYNTYWPVGGSGATNLMPLYPGVTLVRDVSF